MGDTAWIACSAQLPRKGTFVLGWEGYWRRWRVYRFDGTDDDGHVMWSDDSESPIEDDEFYPSHWMPLPKPPRKDRR